MAAVTRCVAGPPILSPEDARRGAEEILIEHTVLYPSEEILRIALWGTAAYGLSWFDAHMWAYAEFYGLPVIWTEDFEHGRQYGTVRAMNPFLA
jgi:predicted nucleic acid-binding protein